MYSNIEDFKKDLQAQLETDRKIREARQAALPSVQSINKAVTAYAVGGSGRQVYAYVDGTVTEKYRVIRARKKQGCYLEIKTTYGTWLNPDRVEW